MQPRNKNLLIPNIAFRHWIKHNAHVLIKGCAMPSISRQKKWNQIEGLLILGHVTQKQRTGSNCNSEKKINLHLPSLWEWVWTLPWRRCRCPHVIEEQAGLHSHYGAVWRTLITVTWMVCPCTIHFVGQSIFIETNSRVLSVKHSDSKEIRGGKDNYNPQRHSSPTYS